MHEIHWLTLNEIWDSKKHFDNPEKQFFDCSEKRRKQLHSTLFKKKHILSKAEIFIKKNTL